MRKYIWIAILLLMPIICIAGGSVQIWDAEADKLDLKADEMTIKSVTLSSNTATEIEPAKSARKGIYIKNVTGGSYTIYLATYAATSNSNLYDLVNAAEFSDEGIQCYIGAWYGLSTAGISTSTVKVIEKW